MWNEIMREIAWNERKDDILDPATVVKFGKLKAAQILLYGRLRHLDRSAERIYAELELHATDIATKQHIWGGNFAFRYYMGKDASGIISLDPALRQLLKKNFAEVYKSLQVPAVQSKLAKTKQIAVVPLAGDIDQYLTGLAIETLSQTQFFPQNPQLATRAQVYEQIRMGQLKSDAVLYGAVRDLRMTRQVETRQGKTVQRKSTVHADIQLFIEDARTGSILWSKTVTLAEPLTTERAMTAQELEQARQQKIEALPDTIKEDVADNWKSYALLIGGIIGGIVLLLLVIFVIRAYISYHQVR